MTAREPTDDSGPGRGSSPLPRSDGALSHNEIAGFEVLKMLGRGARSSVYEVRRTGDGKDGETQDCGRYALKILDSPLTTDREMAAWRREAAVLASIDHPQLSRVHEVGQADTRPYLVMDLIDGRLLADVIADGPLTPAKTIALMQDLLGPLSALHRKGLMHRDIKPDNIMVLPDGTARLIDFGLVSRDTAAEVDEASGTFAYAAPEQSGVLRRPIDGRSDLYSLGVVAFECLTGHAPFRCADVGELLRMHAVTAPPDLRILVPAVTSTLAAIVATLLAKDPDDRYENGDQLASDLTRLAADPTATFNPRSGASQCGDRLPLVGRAAELAHISTAWMQAVDGVGGVCIVRAAGGAGKTRLALELTDRAASQGATVLHGKCFPEDSLPMASLRSALAGHLDSLDNADGAAPTVQNCDQYALTVVALLADLAQRSGGLLLHLDDIQWLDDLSLLVLSRLANVIAGLPMLVLLTARTSAVNADTIEAVIGQVGGNTPVNVELSPLPDASVAELVAGLMPGVQADTDLIHLLVARSNGNPFIAGEYLNAIVDAGLLLPHWGTWSLDVVALNALELPENALDLVLSRLGNLDPATRDLLVTAAACDARFRPDVLAAVHGVALGVAIDAIAQARSRGLVEAGTDGTYAFVHDRISEALTATLDDSSTAEIHRRIAEALDRLSTDAERAPEEIYALARHYMAGPHEATRDRAFAICRTAGELALKAFAPAQASTFLRHAALLGASYDSAFLLTYATALKQSGQYTAARQQLDAALQIETNPAVRAQTYALLADVHRSVWDSESGEAALAAGLRELGAALPKNPVMRTLSTVAMYLVALVIQTTGWRRGTARGQQRVRCTLIASLHEVGSNLGVISMRPMDTVVHNLRALYWVNRLGEGGAEYARSQGTYGSLCTYLGLMRAARRAFARAGRTTHEQPALRALMMHYKGAALCVGYHDDGEFWLDGIQEQGQWLELAAYCDAVSGLLQAAIGAGRTQEAAMLAELGRARLGTRSGEVTSMIFTDAIMAAVGGNPSQAATELHRVEDELVGCTAASIKMCYSMAELMVLHEQNELGAPFDEAVARFEAFDVRPAQMLRGLRLGHFHIAMGRLAQYRAAAPQDRVEKLALARAAVAILGKAVKSDDCRARSLIAQADLKIVEGAPAKALSILTKMPCIHHPPVPLLAFEAARVRARAFIALGGIEESHQQALLALAIARSHDWTQQATWVGEEFDIDVMTGAGLGNVTYAGTDNHPDARTRYHGTSTGSSGLQRQRLNALERVGKAAAQVTGPGSLARIALDQTIQILNADRAFLFLRDDDGVLHPHLGRDADGADLHTLTGYSTSLVERVNREREPLVITGTDQGEALGAQSVVLHGLRSIMVAPLELEGRLLGVVYLDSQLAKGIFAASDVGILLALTNHIATSLETARAAELAILVQTARRERDFAEAMRRSLEYMADTVEPDVVLARLLSRARDITRSDEAWVIGASPDGFTLTAAEDNSALVRTQLPSDPAADALLRIDRPMIGQPAGIPGALTYALAGARSWIAVPLSSGSVDLGVLILASGTALDDRVEVVSTLAAQAVTAYDRARLFARVQALAVADELTGIANRRRFFEVAERDFSTAMRADSPLTGIMLDIDKFKQINDTYGHPTGDDVIRVVAQRLSAQIRHTDMIGRYGGEEFAAVTGTAAYGDSLAERLRVCIDREPIQTRSGPIHITVSVGVAHRTQIDPDAATLLARADQALYRAKRNGRNQVVILDDDGTSQTRSAREAA